MTKNNEQIIIDGCNVSECAFYSFSNWNNHLCRSKEFSERVCTCCNSNPNCYYKQLKRKEQECEKANKNAQDTYDLFQAQMESFNILHGEKIKLETQLDLYKQSLKTEQNKRRVFEQTLEEIREICNNNDELKGDFNLVDCDKYKYGKYNLANKILNKINEAINA